MVKYIHGLEELNQKLESEWTRTQNKWLDLDRFDLPGAQVVDRYTFHPRCPDRTEGCDKQYPSKHAFSPTHTCHCYLYPDASPNVSIEPVK